MGRIYKLKKMIVLHLKKKKLEMKFNKHNIHIINK